MAITNDALSVNTHDILSYALDYAKRGWHLFPCSQQDKKPLVAADIDCNGEKIEKTGGLYKATTDEAQIREWWTRWPNAMIGVRMGAKSKVWAIDPDAPEGDKPDGLAAWAALCARHVPIHTHTHLSPRGGQHLLFRFDPKRPVGNKEGLLTGKGINVRGEGGYIIAPPSIRSDGKVYAVADPMDFWNFADAPDWLYDLISPPQVERRQTISERAISARQPRNNGRDLTYYGRAALAGEANKVATEPDGNRNKALNKAAYALGGLVDSGALSECEIREALYDAADSNGLVKEDGARAVKATIDSGLKAGIQKPREIQERDDNVEILKIFGGNSNQEQSVDAESQPIDLWAELSTPSLPDGALPKVIEDLARKQSKLMGVDPGGLAAAALTVCAAAIPDGIQIQVKEHDTGWTESARFWCGLVGPPSTKKTPMVSVAVAPLRRIDGELFREYAEAKERYEALTPKERKGVARPLHKRAMLQDVTIEHVQEVMRDSPDGILVFHDELSGWFGAMDKYNSSAGAMSNRAFWLETFNGKPYTWGRIGRGSGHIANTSASILGGIQPSVVAEGVDDGLIQRICPIVLRPGGAGLDEPSHGAVSAYDAIVPQLRSLQAPTSSITTMSVPLRFATDAQVLRRELEQKHLEMMRLESINPMLAAHLGKYDGIYARLCVLFHCIECVSTSEGVGHFIQAGTAERAAKFLHDYLLRHALAFYGNILGLSDHHSRIIAVAGYILARKLDRITSRDIQRGDRTMRGLSDRDTRIVFEHLEAFGWVNRVAAPRPADPPHWIINPQVHVLFSDRADTERRRREETRAMLSDLLRGSGS